MPKEVSYEDVISVSAEGCVLHKKDTRERETSAVSQGSLMGLWDRRGEQKEGRTTIHHFCTVTDALQLPEPYRGLWRQHQTQGRRGLARTMLVEVSTGQYTHTCRGQLYGQLCITLVDYTCILHFYITLVRYTCVLHLCITLVHYTCALHLCITFIQYTCTLYLYTMLVHYTCTLHVYITLVHCTCALHLYITLVHYTYT